MSDEHAPLRLLRQVFGSDIISVMSDTGERGDVRTATFGEVQMICRAGDYMACVGGSSARSEVTMQAALFGAIAGRISRSRHEVERAQREAAALSRLRVPVPE